MSLFFFFIIKIMPYQIKPVSKTRYEVENPMTGAIHSKGTTLPKAQAQLKLLNAIKHGFNPKRVIPPPRITPIKMPNARPIQLME
jgi:hypothetical protein